MRERDTITVSSLADQMAELVRCAFLEGFNAGKADPRPRDAGTMAEAWINSRAYDAVMPGAAHGHACDPGKPCDICGRNI